MKLPLSWIREMVAVEVPPKELAHALTMAGTEVESLQRVGADWKRVIVARIQELDRMPKTDNLFVARIDAGEGLHTVVTGAPNLRVGDKVPWVQPGGELPGGFQIMRRTFRGVESEGMLCAADELGIGTDHEGIYVLEPNAPVGVPLEQYFDETVLELKITPNRPDTMNVLGIAREIAALFGLPLRLPSFELPAGGPSVDSLVQVAVADPDLCPRYSASVVLGAQVRPSPTWMQRRLFLSGVRPISNLVDVTNYVMLEVGQPLHAFDRDKLAGTITARRARPGETITTLDGQERELPPGTLVIADARGAQAVAGVMGGLASEVSETTRDVVIEAANFDRTSIRRTSRALRLATEASKRFERGLDPEMTVPAAARAAALMVELAGGTAASGVADAYPAPPAPRIITTSATRVAGLLGKSYPVPEIRDVLDRLGFAVEVAGETIRATVPSWRVDVEGPADIAEEIARITGYEQIPNTLPAGALPEPYPNPVRRWGLKAKRALAAAGLQEVMTYSLVDEQASARLDSGAPYPAPVPPAPGIRLANPLSMELSTLRTTLLGSLLETVRSNLRHTSRVAIFELARVYLPPLDPLPTEQHRLALALTGPRRPTSWSEREEPFDFFDLKGAVEAALSALGLRDVAWRPETHPTLHPGQAAVLEWQGQRVGIAGQVHPVVAERFELDSAVFVAELDFELLAQVANETPPIVTPPRFPGVDMDIAAVVDDTTSHAAVVEAIRAAGAPLLESVRLFDVYRGEPIPPGKKSLAYSLTYRAPDRTLTEAEASEVHQRIEQRLRDQFNAQIRGKG